MKKETTFVISRVTSAVQGSASPMENFKVFQTKRLKAAVRETTHSPLSPGNMKSNLKGHPSVNY